MPGQHIENLFRRYKGEVVKLKTISGGVYSGRITEITNDYVCLSETGTEAGEQVFISFTAVESVVIGATDLH